jgi:hypothetical protein
VRLTHRLHPLACKGLTPSEIIWYLRYQMPMLGTQTVYSAYPSGYAPYTDIRQYLKTRTMNPLTKLYLKTFLLTGIPYGLIMIGFDLLDGDGFKLWKFLSLTLFFGITMSLILVSFHKYRLIKNGIQELIDENLGVTKTKEIKTKLKKTELINKLKTDPIIGKMKMNETETGIALKTGITWKSWGEEIKIILKSETDSDFEYQISSSPKLKTTIVDYGKNLQNLNRIENAIKDIASHGI